MIDNEGHPSYLSDLNTNIPMGLPISSEKKEKILPYIRLNFGKISEREMARRLNIGKTTVNSWKKEIGLITQKNTVDESFFKSWSDEMVYILGFIYADGNINWNIEKSYRALTITAAAKDKKHLENIRHRMKSTKPLLYSSKTNSYRLIVNNKAICQDLMEIGLTPRKLLTVKFPEIPSKHLKDFIRGVIDGDGNIRYVNRKKSPYFEITISSGSEEFLSSLAEKVKTIGIEAKVRKHSGNTFILQYSCKRGLALARWIYTNKNLCLKRKLKQYEIALKEVESHES